MSAEDFATLRLERVSQVLRVTIDHPSSPLNAVDDRLHRDLTALFAGLKRENEARAGPTARGQIAAPPSPATIPTLTWGSPMVAVSAMKMTSQRSAIDAPRPMA